MTQRYKAQLATGLPEVDLFLGTDEFPRIGELLKKPVGKGTVHAKRTHYIYNEAMPRVNTLGKFTAYVKVAEGCQHNCSFCIIPAIRGKLRSRPISSVVTEVRHLVDQGVKEINLIAQDLAAYGRETGTADLLDLLKALVAIEGLQWIRCLYVYPENISDEFLEFFATNPKIVKYMDIPVQHASDDVLRRMNRCVDRKGLEQIFAKLRSKVPEMAIRTSVMVGFPGETEEDFAQLLQFVEEQRFTHLGCFSYSQEENTPAGRMKDQIAEDTKAARLAAVMELQRKVSGSNLERFVGKVVPVLVEGPSPDTPLVWQGRMSVQAPEVDGVVYLTDGPVKAGEIQFVEVQEAHDYDLVGRVLESPSSESIH